MNNYAIDFQDKAVVVVNLANNETSAMIHHPKLESEITLPIKYTVSTVDDHLIGTVISSLPEKNRIIMRNGSDISTLIIGGNEELILKTKDKKYDIGKIELTDLVDVQSKQYQDAGFIEGFKLRSSEETGSLVLFEKDSHKRAILSLDTSDYKEFLPLIMYTQIESDLNGKTIKQKIPIQKGSAIPTEEKEEGLFAKWVKEKFKARIVSDSFSYQNQLGEKERLFEYLDKGLRPAILNGPTGNGKSVLAKDYASSRGLPFYFDTGSSSFKLSTALGKFVPSPGNPTYSPGSLTLAAIFGGVYVLEEMPPIPQDELTGLNIFLETMELPIISQFGYEVIHAHPNFRFIATGNFHSNYTTNELNDAFLQRFTQIKMGYPSRDNTVDILQARAPGLDYETAELVTDAVIDLRKEAMTFSKDLGLKGAVELAQRIQLGTDISMRELFEDNIVNPLTTYENNIERKDGKLYTRLMAIVDKYV